MFTQSPSTRHESQVKLLWRCTGGIALCLCIVLVFTSMDSAARHRLLPTAAADQAEVPIDNSAPPAATAVEEHRGIWVTVVESSKSGLRILEQGIGATLTIQNDKIVVSGSITFETNTNSPRPLDLEITQALSNGDNENDKFNFFLGFDTSTGKKYTVHLRPDDDVEKTLMRRIWETKRLPSGPAGLRSWRSGKYPVTDKIAFRKRGKIFYYRVDPETLPEGWSEKKDLAGNTYYVGPDGISQTQRPEVEVKGTRTNSRPN